MIEVTLTPEQEIRGATRGFTRQRNAVERQLRPRHRAASLWGSHAEGACAELAGHLTLGLDWTGERFLSGPGLVPPPDLGENTEVRWVAPTSAYTLNIDAKRDDPDRDYVLVIGFAPVFQIIGYRRGGETRQTRWLKVYPEREVFQVPASELVPLNFGESNSLR
jgi:hypothetical protein